MRSLSSFVAILIILLAIFSCNKKISGPIVLEEEFVYYPLDSFSMGADLSYVNQVEDYGGIYRDSGQVRDPFRIFKDHGCNTVRVRLWHNPDWYYDVLGDSILYSDLKDVEKTIRRAKDLGMAVNLDFHYSDIWADPQQQQTPNAWSGLGPMDLKDSVYNYTLAVLNYLDEQSLAPEMVQIGNEINPGMLHPIGQVFNEDFSTLGELLNSGIRAVRDFSTASGKNIQVIIHYAQLQGAEDWYRNLTHSGQVHDYDIIGLSHYSKWSELNGMSQVTATIKSLRETHDKKVMLVETGYAWTGGYNDDYHNLVSAADSVPGYPYSPEGQLKYMKDLTQAVMDGGGSGIQVWEPAWISSNLTDFWGTGSPWENMTFFDFQGNTLQGIDFMRVKYGR